MASGSVLLHTGPDCNGKFMRKVQGQSLTFKIWPWTFTLALTPLQPGLRQSYTKLNELDLANIFNETTSLPCRLRTSWCIETRSWPSPSGIRRPSSPTGPTRVTEIGPKRLKSTLPSPTASPSPIPRQRMTCVTLRCRFGGASQIPCGWSGTSCCSCIWRKTKSPMKWRWGRVTAFLSISFEILDPKRLNRGKSGSRSGHATERRDTNGSRLACGPRPWPVIIIGRPTRPLLFNGGVLKF